MKFNSAEAAFAFLESFTNLEKSPNLTAREYRLDRMWELLKLFDNPQNAFKSIHVAGSKGKGSTASFMAAVLSANGLKTGLFCSPHVQTYKERISEAGVFFEDAVYAETASFMMTRLDEFGAYGGALTNFPGGAPTTFELLTLLSFLVFRRTGCEWAVFETGLGGRLDATNVLIPEASVLTIIELEHTDYLGNTIKEIAGEKAGIIKQGVPVYSARQKPEAESVFRKRAEEAGSALFFPDDLVHAVTDYQSFPATVSSEYRQSFRLKFKNSCEYNIRLKTPGRFQADNAVLAVSCLSGICETRKDQLPCGFDPSLGISSASLPGRAEIIPGTVDRPVVILDGAHTVESIRAASEAFFSTAFEAGNSTNNSVLVFGAVEGKDIAGMARQLDGKFGTIIISTPGNFKKSDPRKVFSVFSDTCGDNSTVLLEKDPETALKTAVSYNFPILVAGSFYMVAEIRKCFY